MRNLIPVKCTNQTLYFERLQPVITSGDINEDVIVFDFCPMWDGFQKTAVFYRSAGDVYHVLVDNENTCLIPKEVLADPGEVHFGVFGVKDDRRRTSEEILLTIKQGAITEATTVSDPTPDIYTQLVSMMNATSAKVEETPEGALITIEDVHGKSAALVKNGKDGKDGKEGGYYVPGVEMRGTDSFDLYFEPTQEGMKAPQTFNIQIPAGPQGPQGEQGPAGLTLQPIVGQHNKESFYIDFVNPNTGEEVVGYYVNLLPGPQGEPGPRGERGEKGEPGRDAGGVFELLDTIELAEDRTLSDNIPACTRLFLKLKTTTDSLGSIIINAAMSGTALGRGTFSTISAAGTYYGILDVWQEAGWWRARNLRWTTKKGVSVPNDGNDWDNYLTKSVAAYPAINRITSSAALPAGTTIEVWGVPLADEYAAATLEELEY